MSSPKILLVEDDELFRLGLVTRLNLELNPAVIAEAEDGETAIALINQQLFDLVLLDVGLAGMGGIETCRAIKKMQPNLPVLILTSHDQPHLIVSLIEAKANGYCVKGITAENLILAIRSIIAGATWWDAIASQQIQSRFYNSPINYQSTIKNPLTQREQEILSLIAEGKTNQEIADVLYISAGTVRVHVHSILHKLQVSDRTQAVVIAIQHKWI